MHNIHGTGERHSFPQSAGWHNLVPLCLWLALPMTVVRVLNTLGKVLVHCRQGFSRSPAIVAAFLMQKRGEDLGLQRTHFIRYHPLDYTGPNNAVLLTVYNIPLDCEVDDHTCRPVFSCPWLRTYAFKLAKLAADWEWWWNLYYSKVSCIAPRI